MVIRVFVEKRHGFDVEAAHLLADLRDNLSLPQLTAVRLLNRYDIEGLTPEEFERARPVVFAEPNADYIYGDAFEAENGWTVFATEYLPGQYDQRADSAEQCVQLLTGGERPRVATARVVALQGKLSEADMRRVKKYLINPVESREAVADKPETLDRRSPAPPDVAVVEGFCGLDDAAIDAYHGRMGFAMSAADLRFCRDYFRDEERRDTTLTELRVIDTYWSDHCRHTTFLTQLEDVTFEDGPFADVMRATWEGYLAARREVYGARAADKPVTLMNIATMGMKWLKKQGKLPDLDESDEINACSIEVPVTVDGETQTWLLQFKNETHNHPTEIEPFGGAATCLGGAIRDPLSGRAYVYQAMRVTGSGNPLVSVDETMPGKLPARKITTGAAAGYSSYGNQIGLATGQISELYDDGYAAKRLEIGFVIGACPKSNVRREMPAPGDVVVLLGGRTGRDGCGGATGSSKAHDTQSLDTCGAEVQKGNPPTERKIQRLFRDPAISRLIKRCNDFGAGGVSVAIGELADGLDIDLDAVPKKYDGLDGTELAISESQERMAVVLSPADVPAFLAGADRENLEVTPVAVVTAEPRLRMRWRGKDIVDIGRAFLDTNGVPQTARAAVASPSAHDARLKIPPELSVCSLGDAFKENLRRLDVCSRQGLAERFDASIGAGTVLMPFAGARQLSPEDGMAAKLPVLTGETDDATVVAFGASPDVFRWSPFHGAVYVVMASLAKLAGLGVDPALARLTFQEYFERLRDDPARWGKPAAALLGAFLAQTKMGVPAIGGKDSMSGSFGELDVPPTLVSFAVGIGKASQTGTAAFQKSGSLVALLELPVDEKTRLPDFDAARELFTVVSRLVRFGAVRAASAVGAGGAAATVARMCLGNHVGFAFDRSVTRAQLFAPLCGSLVLELKEGDVCLQGLAYQLIGTTTDDACVLLDGAEMGLDGLCAVWQSTLEPVFPMSAPPAISMLPVPFYTERNAAAPAVKAARPRVCIPVFPGTNCEVDTARAFERAGADTDIIIVRNQTPAAIGESIARL
ncbi:MAG: phosphoribosylformylglycinamidine synthase, partial [Oscillospiraceae bacterium]|nr:phosphoribosylformylglycinamidine synthase [Oscillospiraceae bacterium]